MCFEWCKIKQYAYAMLLIKVNFYRLLRQGNGIHSVVLVKTACLPGCRVFMLGRRGIICPVCLKQKTLHLGYSNTGFCRLV
ncbi:hypothetical protein C7N43_33365 [Sphingobacteriales bacterium UPWRP_1]|nr:hypothetical protein C7N43_33365 [Sphingobacteriales bacterium UPWRP_1]